LTKFNFFKKCGSDFFKFLIINSSKKYIKITFYCDCKSSSYYHRGVLLSVGTQLRVLDDRAKVERFIEWREVEELKGS
jgi:hypothetical protein